MPIFGEDDNDSVRSLPRGKLFSRFMLTGTIAADLALRANSHHTSKHGLKDFCVSRPDGNIASNYHGGSGFH